ncbi:uncharacterized [Tachysurus ichikawai]
MSNTLLGFTTDLLEWINPHGDLEHQVPYLTEDSGRSRVADYRPIDGLSGLKSLHFGSPFHFLATKGVSFMVSVTQLTVLAELGWEV